jgi:small subunit ribosomal protein S1
VGDVIRGKVTKLTSFGVFVELTSGLEGLLHISELSEKKVASPEEIVRPGDEVDVRIIRVERESRKIGLSLKKAKGLPDDAPQPGIVSRAPVPPPQPAAETKPEPATEKPAEAPAPKAEAPAPATAPAAPPPASPPEGEPKKE